ncbi:MAG TPA: HAMP domain-containing sensor histidine kinase [Actinomycetota bacterium]
MARRGTSFAVSAPRSTPRPRDREIGRSPDAQVAVLARGLVGARTREDAIEASIRFCAEGMDMPAAVWVLEPHEGILRLVGVWGLDREQRDAVQRALGFIPDGAVEDFEPAAAAFEELTGAAEVNAVRVGSVLLVHADAPPAFAEVLSAVADLLHESLARFDDGATADVALGLALTAHELRAPILGARAAVERLMGAGYSYLSDDLVLLREAEQELAGLSGRVDQLLRWSVGTRPPLRVPSDLVAMVREAATTCSRGGDGRRVRIKAPRQLVAAVDEAHIMSAVENLISNALAYSPTSGSVDVTLLRRQDMALIRVRDHGPGISPEERECAFDPFQRGCAGRVRRGHGLGLFIAKRIVEEHDGQIGFRRAPGGGTCFTVRLPLR